MPILGQDESKRPLCRQFDSDLQSYLEGEDRPGVLTHAAECATCNAILRDLEEIRLAAKAVTLDEPSPRVWANIRATLAAEGILREQLCRQFDSDLQSYLEGEDRPGVLTHAAECATCNAILCDLEEISLAAKAVALDEPSPRVWANIRAALATEGILREQPAGWRAWFAAPRLLRYTGPAVAMAGLLVLAATLATLRPRSGTNLSDKSTSPVANAQLTETPAIPGIAVVEQTVRELEKNFKAREDNLDPILKANYQKGLDSLDDSIRECRASVQQEPSNELAQQYLMTAYEQKAAVLEAALEYDGR